MCFVVGYDVGLVEMLWSKIIVLLVGVCMIWEFCVWFIMVRILGLRCVLNWCIYKSLYGYY